MLAVVTVVLILFLVIKDSYEFRINPISKRAGAKNAISFKAVKNSFSRMKCLNEDQSTIDMTSPPGISSTIPEDASNCNCNDVHENSLVEDIKSKKLLNVFASAALAFGIFVFQNYQPASSATLLKTMEEV